MRDGVRRYELNLPLNVSVANQQAKTRTDPATFRSQSGRDLARLSCAELLQNSYLVSFWLRASAVSRYAYTDAALDHISHPCLVKAFCALVVLKSLLQYARSIVGLVFSPYLEK
jgi:hypothetical protein